MLRITFELRRANSVLARLSRERGRWVRPPDNYFTGAITC